MKFDQDGWLDVAKEYNLTNNSWPRNGVTPTHLVIHGTAGGSDGGSVAAYMGSVGVSTHFVISIDGTPWQCVSADAAAWANAPLKSPLINFVHADLNPNLWTISIEFCKPDVTNQVNITAEQQRAGFALIAAICDQYHIPKRKGDENGGIIGHADINSIDRAMCPGTFPFDELWTFLQQGNAMTLDISQASQYFVEVTKDQRWHCKSTGYDVAGAILNYYRTCTQTGLNGLSQFGLPTSGELYHAAISGVTYQEFERGIIVFDSAHKDDSVPGVSGPCYPGHLDRFVKPATPVDVPGAITLLRTIQTAIGGVITKLGG